MALCGNCRNKIKAGFQMVEPKTFLGCKIIVCDKCNEEINDLIKKIDELSGDELEEKEIDLQVEIKGKVNDAILLEKFTQYIDNKRGVVSIDEQPDEEVEKALLRFMITTGPSFEGYTITKYCGVTSGEVVIGTGLFSEGAAAFSDLLGITSRAFSDKMHSVKKKAIKELKKHALKLGANAVIALDFDYLTFSSNMIGISANGTAVYIEKKDDCVAMQNNDN